VWHGMPKSGIGGFFPWLNAEEIRLVTVGRKKQTLSITRQRGKV